MSPADGANGAAGGAGEPVPAPEVPIPLAMLAELTHRCPLKCPYCSNPLELVRRSSELDTETWLRVFREAAGLGVLQLHLSGGEPAARKDLEALTEGARRAGLYTNLITSGIGLTRERMQALAAVGLDHVQLSVQGADAAMADMVGGLTGAFETKMRVAEWVAEEGLPLTVNAVMHRKNLGLIEETIALAERLGARRLEVANTQYHGWAYKNRASLMPTREQVLHAGRVVAEARARLEGVMVIDYVTPDHFAKYPKPCMGGWARMGLCVVPDGTVLPCHAAQSITSLRFETVHEKSLGEIWSEGPAFRAYRGTGWMPEPCQSCDRKTRDWGGCRCQAFAWTGDAGATDPVCSKTPQHAEVLRLAEADAAPLGEEPAFAYRSFTQPA